jgi:multidrug resistance efflux pump
MIRQAEADLNARAAHATFANEDAVRYRDLAATTFGTRQNAERASATDPPSSIRDAELGSDLQPILDIARECK